MDRVAKSFAITISVCDMLEHLDNRVHAPRSGDAEDLCIEFRVAHRSLRKGRYCARKPWPPRTRKSPEMSGLVRPAAADLLAARRRLGESIGQHRRVVVRIDHQEVEVGCARRHAAGHDEVGVAA